MLESLFQQFLISFGVLIIINISFTRFSDLISFIGSLTVLAILSWKTVIYARKYYFSQSKISSFKKAVLITGCDSGFGNRLALRLNKYGFRVYATVLDAESDGAKSLALNAVLPNSLVVIKMDVKRDSDVSQAFEIVSEDLNTSGHQLWGVVNNAGIVVCGFVDWGSIESYQNVCDVNLFGAIRVTRTFLPLIRQSKGRIVNVSSIAGKLSMPFMSHYSLSKAALIAFSDSLRKEISKSGVRVSVILPAAFKTPIASAESLKLVTINEWRKTDESVRQVYGNSIERLTDRLEQIVAQQASDNVDLVIDAMSDALVNRDPEESYVVADGWVSSIMTTAVLCIPTKLLNSLANKIFDI